METINNILTYAYYLLLAANMIANVYGLYVLIKAIIILKRMPKDE